MLPVLLLVITSCNDKVDLTESTTDYKFQKELTIYDGNGNSADLLIHTNTEEALADQTTDVLILTTSTVDYSKSTDQNINFEETGEIDYNEENEVFVFVTSYNFHPHVTAFNVRSKIESIRESNIQTRATDTDYHYAYGSDGVTGAYVKYLSQTCSQEYLTTKLSKKNSSWSLFWNKLGSGTLNSPGNSWTCNSNTNYYKFKLRVRGKQGCTGTATYSYNWLT